MIMLGLATKEFRELFHHKKIKSIIKETLHEPSKSIEAFDYGYNLIDN